MRVEKHLIQTTLPVSRIVSTNKIKYKLIGTITDEEDMFLALEFLTFGKKENIFTLRYNNLYTDEQLNSITLTKNQLKTILNCIKDFIVQPDFSNLKKRLNKNNSGVELYNLYKLQLKDGSLECNVIENNNTLLYDIAYWYNNEESDVSRILLSIQNIQKLDKLFHTSLNNYKKNNYEKGDR